ncbi:flavin-containing monooxygenase [Solicola sp. PLA-1-18]|uniref:flavin-containing monooxygenase n=1 Tax=Solicola sp. PLA-1-18 TaxID=3380532 RepID=UPI003B775DAC
MTRTVVVGAGLGGVACAVELLRAGHRDVTVLERADAVGGVWRANTYPGAACDVPSALYSYSFAPNPDWSRRYAPQPEIQAYVERVVDEHGVRPHLRLGVGLVSATWDDESSRWHLALSDGSSDACDVLVSAVGQLSEPARAELPGLESFAGPVMHTAEWDGEHDLAGRRVVVVGTGASSVQAVPLVAEVARHLTVLQRTPPYVMPKPDREHGRPHRWLATRFPSLLRAERRFVWGLTELLAFGLSGDGRAAGVVRRGVQTLCLLHLRRSVPDADVRARLTPDHPAGCKRLLFSNDYLPTFARPDVDLVTEPIVEVTADGVRTTAGLVPADAIVLGTGFLTQPFLASIEVRGRGGRTLAQEWAGGAYAYLGTCVPGFPNLFVLYGPNTNTGSSSVVGMLEAQARYVRQAVDQLGRRGARAVEVRREVAREFDDRLQARLRRTVWTHCASWYREASGRISSNWPGRVRPYEQLTGRLDPDDFEWAA